MNQLNIYQKIKAVRERVKEIPKNGFNKFANYKYVDKDTLYDYLRAYFNEVGLALISSTESVQREQRKNNKGELFNASIVTKKHTIVNIDNPDEKIEVLSAGVGEDKTDKDIYQADTGAMKYFLIDNFFISGGDSFPGDVEHDRKESKQAEQKGTTTVVTLEEQARITFRKNCSFAQKELATLTGNDEMFWQIIGMAGYSSVDEIPAADYQKIKDSLKAKMTELKTLEAK
jgi:hypothetical protein